MAIYYNGHLQATKGGGGSSGGGGIDYSTTEQDTGLKWIDGKPIYQKTFNITAINTYINFSDLNIDTFCRVDGLVKTTSNAVIGIFTNGGSNYVSNLEIDYVNMRMQLLMSGWTFSSGFATLYYTKTTDTV